MFPHRPDAHSDEGPKSKAAARGSVTSTRRPAWATLTSVNSFTYRGLKGRMFGPYLGNVEASTFGLAKTVSVNSLG